MTEPNDQNAPLVAPASYPKRDVVRAAVEALAGIEPITAGLTRIYQTTHPSKTAQERAEWENAATERVNAHGEQLDRHEGLLVPKETIDGLRAQLVARMIRECPDGLGCQHFDLDALCTLALDNDRQAVEDAAYDLEVLGLVKRRLWIGGWSVALSESAYDQLDRQLMDWDTAADAVEIARLMAAETIQAIRDLHERTGWSKRRFNPAFRMLLPIFHLGLVFRENQADYPTAYVLLVPHNKAALRRFLAKADGTR